MKTKFVTLTAALLSLFISGTSSAQTTAMDFNRKDCNGITHSLFGDLNSGKAVIIEYFMTSCAPCPAAGQVLEAMKANLLTQYPGKIKSYSIAFNNTYSCSTVLNWVNTYSFTSVPMDSGATQVAYYGGMGMPTIVILGGGTSHSVLGSPYIGFVNSDTTTMANDIRNSLNTLAGIKENQSSISGVKLFPNPTQSEVKVEFVLKAGGNLKIDVIDITGKVVNNLSNEKVPAGNYSKLFNVQAIPEGNYIIKIATDDVIINQKLTIVK